MLAFSSYIPSELRSPLNFDLGLFFPLKSPYPIENLIIDTDNLYDQVVYYLRESLDATLVYKPRSENDVGTKIMIRLTSADMAFIGVCIEAFCYGKISLLKLLAPGLLKQSNITPAYRNLFRHIHRLFTT